MKNLLWHQFRHEVRSHRLLLVAFFGALLMNLLLGCNNGNRDHQWWATIALVLLFVITVAAPILADSPSQNDRFLTTKPLSRRTVFACKLLFIFGLLALPLSLADTLAIAMARESFTTALFGGLDRLLILTPVTLLIVSFAALYRTHLESFLAAMTVSFFAFSAFFSSRDLSQRWAKLDFLWENSLAPSPLCLALGCLIFTILLMLLLPLRKRGLSGSGLLFVQGIAISLTVLLMSLFPTARLALLSQEQREISALLLASEPPTLTSRNSDLQRGNSRRGIEVHYSPQAVRELARLHPHAVMHHQLTHLTVQDPLGETLAEERDHDQGISFHAIDFQSSELSPGLQSLLAKNFPDLRAVRAGEGLAGVTGFSVPNVNSYSRTNRSGTARSTGTVKTNIGEWVLESRTPLHSHSSSPKSIEVFRKTLQPAILSFGPSGEPSENLLAGLYFPSEQTLHFGSVSHHFG